LLQSAAASSAVRGCQLYKKILFLRRFSCHFRLYNDINEPNNGFKKILGKDVNENHARLIKICSGGSATAFTAFGNIVWASIGISNPLKLLYQLKNYSNKQYLTNSNMHIVILTY